MSASTTTIIILFVVSIIFLGVSITVWLYYYHLMSECYSNPNIWCWTDWTCPTTNPSLYDCPAQDLYGCTPGTTLDSGYCEGDGADTVLCSCKNGSNVNDTCTCKWNAAGSAWTSGGGSCGTQYCEGDTTSNLKNCQG